MRIRRLDGRFNSFVALDEAGALAAARESDARLARGEPRSMLEGIPISVKDNIHVPAFPSTWGSRALAGFHARAATSCRSRGCARPARSSSARPTCRNSRWKAIRQRSVRRHAQSRGILADPRRLLRRRGGERGGGLVPGGALHRRRRLDPAPRVPHRPRRLQTLGRTDRARRRVAGDPRRFRDHRHAHAHRRRRAAARLGHGRSRPARPPVALRHRDAFEGRTRRASCLSRSSGIARSIRRWRRPPPRSRASSRRAATRCSEATCSSISKTPPASGTSFRAPASPGCCAGGRRFAARPARPRERWPRTDTNSPAPTTSMRWSGSPRSAAAAPNCFARVDLVLTPTAAALPWPAEKPYPDGDRRPPAGPRDHAMFTGWVNIARPAGDQPAGGCLARRPADRRAGGRGVRRRRRRCSNSPSGSSSAMKRRRCPSLEHDHEHPPARPPFPANPRPDQRARPGAARDRRADDRPSRPGFRRSRRALCWRG